LTRVKRVTFGTFVDVADHVAENGAAVIVCVEVEAPGSVIETDEIVRPL
jgi:uncharacterized UPF0146 family protein